MSRDELLAELAILPHSGRMHRMVELGRAKDPGSVAALAEMRRGGGYERRLALQAAWGSRDPAVAAEGLADPSRLTRAMARDVAATLCSDAQLAAAVDASPIAGRRGLLNRMRKRDRRDAIDGVLQAFADRGDPEYGRFLAYGSETFVARHLPGAARTVGALDWRALARHHPRTAAAILTEAVGATAELDARLAAEARTALPVLIEICPDAAVELAAALAQHLPLASLPLIKLVGCRPAAVADLCLGAPAPCPVSFAAVAARLDSDRLLALLARFGTLGDRLNAPHRWLRRIAPDLRAAVYEVANRGWRDRNGAVPLAVLLMLPRPLREAEAHRHLTLPALATRPSSYLPYAGLLAWNEARTYLNPFLGDPDAELRATALATLVACVRFERERVTDLLALVLARRFEQDPVRAMLLGAMADLPISMWDAIHLSDLGMAFRHALDAADLSNTTSMQIGRIAIAQLPRHPDWAAGWLATLARERGTLTMLGFDGRLQRTDVRRLAPVLAPVLDEWLQRERDDAVFALAATLGRHLAPAWDGLADVLEQIARCGTAASAGNALKVLKRSRPDRLRTLVPVLLQEDPSWATQPPAFTHLHRHRQDLLTPFLGRTTYKGRFATGDTATVLPFRAGFERWTPVQQALFAASVGSVIADEKRDSPALLGAVAQLAALPDTEPDMLVLLAALDEPRPVAREAALRGLGRRDTGDGLPTLLAALDDTRARIAAYALRRTLGEMPAPRAFSILRAVPRQKVTVAKEVVRLVGELPGEDAYAWLLSLLAPGEAAPHRDVIVALMRALWSRLERDETWVVLDGAAASTDPAIAVAASRVPGNTLSPHAEERLAHLLAGLLAHLDPRVRMAALSRCTTQPLADRGEALLSPLLDALASPLPDECAAAAKVVFATYAARRAARVGEVAVSLRANRRAMSVLVAELQQWAVWRRDRSGPTVVAVLRALSPDPALAGLCAELAASALSAVALPAWFEEAVETLHAGSLPRATVALEMSNGLRPEELEAVEAALTPAEDERLRRLALAALCAQAGRLRLGWTVERQARLEAFRADLSPLVAEAAQFIFLPDERGPAGIPPPRRRSRGTVQIRLIGRN